MRQLLSINSLPLSATYGANLWLTTQSYTVQIVHWLHGWLVLHHKSPEKTRIWPAGYYFEIIVQYITFIEQLLWFVHAKGQRLDDVGEEIRSAAICLHIPPFHSPIDLHTIIHKYIYQKWFCFLKNMTDQLEWITLGYKWKNSVCNK